MRWVWNEAEAEAKNISDDVVEVMAEKIKTLPDGAQDVLKKSSCIGASFDASTVQYLITDPSIIANFDSHLIKLVKQGLIIKMIRHDTKKEDTVVHYKFSHDRIQEVSVKGNIFLMLQHQQNTSTYMFL